MKEKIRSRSSLFLQRRCTAVVKKMRVSFCVFISADGKCTYLYIQIIQLANLDGYHMDILATVTTVRKFSPHQNHGMKPEASLPTS